MRGARSLTARQVDAVLEVLILVAAASGIASLAVGTSWGRAITAVHGMAGLTLVVLVPAKANGSVRTGLRRGRASRWVSVAFGVLVLATIALGFLHSTGLWHGVGFLTALWTHEALAFAVLALLGWHVFSRPGVRPKVADLQRRALLGAGGAAVLGAAAYGTQEVLARVAGLAGGTRRFTGSHAVGSFAPAAMPTVQWINDTSPASTAADDWALHVAGRPVAVDELRHLARPVRATLDCTGGWSSTQSWDAVPLAAVLADPGQARSVKVTSATGYHRRFPVADLGHVYLATGYNGETLRPGHGAPVRVVAPGRRGPWWVKWVVSIELDDRPWWLQLPFPLD